MEADIRWILRFSNYIKALAKLSQAVAYVKNSTKVDPNPDIAVLDEIIKEGLIQRFEYTHELAWKVMKDYAEYQGNTNIGGSRDAIREALQLKIIDNGEVWMDMIYSRNKSTHTYNEETAEVIYSKIIHQYFQEFLVFKSKMEEKTSDKQQRLF